MSAWRNVLTCNPSQSRNTHISHPVQRTYWFTQFRGEKGMRSRRTQWGRRHSHKIQVFGGPWHDLGQGWDFILVVWDFKEPGKLHKKWNHERLHVTMSAEASGEDALVSPSEFDWAVRATVLGERIQIRVTLDQPYQHYKAKSQQIKKSKLVSHLIIPIC